MVNRLRQSNYRAREAAPTGDRNDAHPSDIEHSRSKSWATTTAPRQRNFLKRAEACSTVIPKVHRQWTRLQPGNLIGH